MLLNGYRVLRKKFWQRDRLKDKNQLMLMKTMRTKEIKQREAHRVALDI